MKKPDGKKCTWVKFSHCIYSIMKEGKLLPVLSVYSVYRVACFSPESQLYLWHVCNISLPFNCKSPKRQPCLPFFGSNYSALYYWGLNFHNLYSYSLIYLRPG